MNTLVAADYNQRTNTREYVILYVLWLRGRQMVSLARWDRGARHVCHQSVGVSQCRSVRSLGSVRRVSVAAEVWRRRDKSRDPVPISTTQRPVSYG